MKYFRYEYSLQLCVTYPKNAIKSITCSTSGLAKCELLFDLWLSKSVSNDLKQPYIYYWFCNIRMSINIEKSVDKYIEQ